jgi:uncharacterized protein YbjQ (UPF0145 family)
VAALRSSGRWGSALTADEFAAIRGAGFDPVGQVFGAAVYSAGSAGSYGCPGAPGSAGDESSPQPPARVPQPPARVPQSATQVSGQGGAGSFAPLVQTMDQARQTAIGRMTTECEALGGHGVVGVHVTRGTFPLGGTQFVVIGTAVRAPSAAAVPPTPFTSDLSGQDFAKLIRTGWVPVGLVLGISIGSRHDDRGTARQARWTAGNAEVAGWTELVSHSRQDARRQLEGDVRRLGAEGAVVAAMQLRVRQRDCPAAVGRHDHIAEATIIGTAVTRFSPPGHHPDGPPLAIMSLDPQRRQAARIRI